MVSCCNDCKMTVHILFTFMHFADAFIQSDLNSTLYIFILYSIARAQSVNIWVSYLKYKFTINIIIYKCIETITDNRNYHRHFISLY